MHSWTFTTRRRWIGMTLRLRWLLSAGRTRVVYRLKRLTSKLGIAPMLRWLIRSLRLAVIRSEEHTSELQSLMRISYAVFCLKKKKKAHKKTPSKVNINTEHDIR